MGSRASALCRRTMRSASVNLSCCNNGISCCTIARTGAGVSAPSPVATPRKVASSVRAACACPAVVADARVPPALKAGISMRASSATSVREHITTRAPNRSSTSAARSIGTREPVGAFDNAPVRSAPVRSVTMRSATMLSGAVGNVGRVPAPMFGRASGWSRDTGRERRRVASATIVRSVSRPHVSAGCSESVATRPNSASAGRESPCFA